MGSRGAFLFFIRVMQAMGINKDGKYVVIVVDTAPFEKSSIEYFAEECKYNKSALYNLGSWVEPTVQFMP